MDRLIDCGRSKLAFDVRHLKVLHVRGCFSEFSGTLSGDADGPTLIEATVDVASVQTGDARRDAGLRSEPFFDADRYPVMTYAGIGPPPSGWDSCEIEGWLTIRDVRRPLLLRARSTRSAADVDELCLHAEGRVSRRDFGLDWDPAFLKAGLAIDDLVRVTIDVVAVPVDVLEVTEARPRHRAAGPPLRRSEVSF